MQSEVQLMPNAQLLIIGWFFSNIKSNYNMRRIANLVSTILIIAVCTLVTTLDAKAQFGFDYYPVQQQSHQNPIYTRGGELLEASFDKNWRLQPAARFLGTLTLTLATSVSTYTITTTTTCSTSTAAIKVCSPSKGRRRRQNFGIHRLMFEEEEFDESNIFAPRNDKLER